jgi:hypothetical protein
MKIHGGTRGSYPGGRRSVLDGCVAAVRGEKGLSEGLWRCVVSYGDIQGIAGFDVEGRFLNAGIGHETMQESTGGICGLLVGESDIQNSI